MPITIDMTTDVGRVRYMIGDDVDSIGVLPTGGNFSDAQVEYELDQVYHNIKLAAVRLCDNLARRWATTPMSFTADGLSVNRGDMTRKWLDLSAEIMSDFQGATVSTVSLDRRDGYSVALEKGGDELKRSDDSTYSVEY